MSIAQSLREVNKMTLTTTSPEALFTHIADSAAARILAGRLRNDHA